MAAKKTPSRTLHVRKKSTTKPPVRKAAKKAAAKKTRSPAGEKKAVRGTWGRTSSSARTVECPNCHFQFKPPL